MKFSDALYNALEKMPKINGRENAVSPQTAKILAVMWNIMAESKIVLDDFVAIAENNTIISIPIDGEAKKPGRKKAVADEVNGSEKEETNTSE